jgi:hypothetical protein
MSKSRVIQRPTRRARRGTKIVTEVTRASEMMRITELGSYRRILSVKGGTIHNEYLLTANRVRAVSSRIRLHP